MVIVIECDSRVNWKPGRYESTLLVRYWWLWFAISFLKVTFDEYSRLSSKVWEIPT